MIPRGQFHIPFKVLIKKSLMLPFQSMKDCKKAAIFKKDLQAFLGSSHLELFSSCRIAFYALLKQLDLPAGSEVLLSPITIPDMVNAILLAGLKPRFIDMDLNTHSIDLNKIVNEGETARILLFTGLSGLSADLSTLKTYCKNHHLILIGDISQVIGAQYENKDLSFYFDYMVCSLSIGKTISGLVGGFTASNQRLIIPPSLRESPPRKRDFLKQLKESIKIDFLTSPFIFNFFTYYLLLFLFKISPKRYFDIHKQGIISKFNKDDLFFDDIPIKRNSFPSSFYFYFNTWMAELGIECLKVWESHYQKRLKLKNIFIEHCSKELKEHIPNSFFSDMSLPIRVPVYCKEKEIIQGLLIQNGIDSTGYGLILCNEKDIFSDYFVSLLTASKIKKETLFISLHEKVHEKDLLKALRVLNDYFSDGIIQ